MNGIVFRDEKAPDRLCVTFTLPPEMVVDLGIEEGHRLAFEYDGLGQDFVAALSELSTMYSLQYLALQNKISHENRQFTMISNIMKTKHDTAKTSVNNI
ncbi:MAG: hypothetical protein ACFFDT_37650, partial [Candidatus Hodarchaeota archaeon]